jgi:hypothetical protein
MARYFFISPNFSEEASYPTIFSDPSSFTGSLDGNLCHSAPNR